MENTTDNVQVTPEVTEQSTPEVQSTLSEISNWRDSLAEDLRSEPSLKDFKDINSLAKSHVSAQKMLGGSIRIPGEDASDEARQEFYSKLSNVEGVV